MPSNITVTVHMKPYIKKYMLHISANKAEPLIFPRKHHFIVSLMPLLVSRSRYSFLKIIETDNYPTSFKPVEIMLPWTKSTDREHPNILRRRYLSPSNEREFRKTVELYWRVFASNRIIETIQTEKETRVDAIDILMNKIMMTDDDFNKESFYRYYTRLMNVLC